jgi:SAM-dependent methyltransferase
MVDRSSDGSAGDADYGVIGRGYTAYRQPDPAIASLIHRSLGEARRVLNVGAGAGSYEPLNREVTAVEPSASMRAQRPTELARAINAVAESLPFPDASFDASMAIFTIHQWKNLDKGLREMRRVTRGPVVILSCAPDLVERFWLADYAPGMAAVEASRYPAIEQLAAALGNVEVQSVPIPLHCTDGFNEAYYGRPESFLDEGARLANSAWSFVDRATSDGYVAHLRRDLDDGTWDSRHGHLRTQPAFEGCLQLYLARPS